MKNLGRHVAALVILVAVILLGGCTFLYSIFDPAMNWELVGTWVNPSYESIANYNAMLVYSSDNTFVVYKALGDTTPVATGTWAITKDWTEANTHWFQVKGVIGASTFYELDKITNDGTMYESTASTTDYPSTIDPALGWMTTLRFRM